MKRKAAADAAYVDAHRFVFGEIGERVAKIALVYREKLMRPGFVLPTIRLAPVSPYGSCMAISSNSAALRHAEGLNQGIWLYLHASYFGQDDAVRRNIEATVLHELLHNELMQNDEDPHHIGQPWATRCQQLSDRLGIKVRIERPRSQRREDGKVGKGTPAGCLSYADLVRWPDSLLADGPSLIDRARAL